MIERKQYKEAVSFLGIAISSQPNEARYYLHRGIAYQKQGNVGMAKADFQQALRLDPSNREAQDSLKSLLKAANEPTTPPTKSSGQKTTSQPSPGAKKAPAKPKDQGGGFFGNLFKKK
jgi:tetratricopeptide (TPR) repeat protein